MKHTPDSTSRGQGLIEFALILPLLILFILGIFDLGYSIFLNNLVSNAAREGARSGIIKGNDDLAIRARVQAAAPGLNPEIIILPPVRSYKNPITVTVTYTYTPMTPFIGNFAGPMRLSSTSVMLVEGVEPVLPP